MPFLNSLQSTFLRFPALGKVLLVVFTLGLAFNWFLPSFAKSGDGFDESMLLVYPELILQGKMPYRDFSSFYGPANLWVLAAFYKGLGISLTSERVVGLLYRMGYLLAVGWMGRRLAPGLSWFLVIVGLISITFINLTAIAWFPACTLVLVSVLIGMAAPGKSTGRGHRTGASGLIAGLALLFRPDVGLALALSSLPMLCLWSWKERRNWLLGATLGLLPLVYMAWRTSLEALWLNLFYLPVIVGSPGRKIPLGTLELTQWFLVILFLGMVAGNLLTSLVLFWRKESSEKERLYLACSLLGLGMSPQILQRCDDTHIAMGMMISFPLFFATLHRWLSSFGWSRICVQLLGALGFAGLLLLPPFRNYLTAVKINYQLQAGQIEYPSYPLRNSGRTFLMDSVGQQRMFGSVLAYLSKASRPGQTVYVAQQDLRRSFTNDIFLYHLLMPKLQPGCYYIESNPLVANAKNSGLERQLAQCDWVVLNERWNYVREENLSSQPGHDGPVRVLTSQFSLVHAAGFLTVYQNNRLRSVKK